MKAMKIILGVVLVASLGVNGWLWQHREKERSGGEGSTGGDSQG